MDSSLGFRVASQLALHMPRAIAYWLAEKVAIVYAMAQVEEKKAVQENLRYLLAREIPPEEQDELERLTYKVYIHFAKYLVDFFQIPKVNHSFIRRFVILEGLKEIDQALQQKRGVVLLTAHLGSWELGGAILATLGYPLDVIALSHQNPWVDRFFLNQRLSKGIHSLSLTNTLKGVIQGLKRNHLVAILGDRDYAHHGVSVSFLGKQVSFPKGPAYLALKTGASLIPVFVLRQEDDKIRMTIQEPIKVSRVETINDEAIVTLTQRCAQVLEEQSRLYPIQWLVFRRFWESI